MRARIFNLAGRAELFRSLLTILGDETCLHLAPAKRLGDSLLVMAEADRIPTQRANILILINLERQHPEALRRIPLNLVARLGLPAEETLVADPQPPRGFQLGDKLRARGKPLRYPMSFSASFGSEVTGLFTS